MEVLDRRGARARDRLIGVAGRRQAVVLTREREHEPQVGVGEVVDVVDEHVAVARRDARAHVRALDQRERRQHEVARIERTLLAQHPVVGEVDLRELALALGALLARRQLGRPGCRPRAP